MRSVKASARQKKDRPEKECKPSNGSRNGSGEASGFSPLPRKRKMVNTTMLLEVSGLLGDLQAAPYGAEYILRLSCEGVTEGRLRARLVTIAPVAKSAIAKSKSR